MSLLTREAILTAIDLKTVDVEVPEWGGTVRLRAMTGTARDEFGRSLLGADGKYTGTGYNAKIAAASIVKEDGELMFTEDDVQVLGERSAAALQRVADAADELNALGAKAVETAKGN